MFSEWLVLALSVPVILVPFVLLFGFAGCGLASAGIPCENDGNCDFGEVCVGGSCVPIGGDGEGPSLAAPQDLEAYAVHDTEIDLSWTALNEPASTTFKVQRVEEGDPWCTVGDPGCTVTEMETTAPYYIDTMGLKEGTTYVYRVVATEYDAPPSDPSNEASATTFPKAPSNLVATAVSVDQIDLSWTNESAVASQFSLQYRLQGALTWDTVPDYNGSGTSFSHTGLAEGTGYEYQVLAVIPVGFQNSVPGQVSSEPSATASATTPGNPWTLAFSASLTDPQDLAGFCMIQRISAAQFALFPTGLNDIGAKVRLTVRSSGPLTLSRIYLSRAASSGDPWDASADLTKVVDVSQGDPPVVFQGSSSQVLAPVSYALDRTQALLVALDISATAGQGNVISVAQSGATHYFKAATQEASVSNRASDFGTGADRHYLIERIEVL